MTKEQACAAALHHMHSIGFAGNGVRDEQGLGLSHLLWMANEMPNLSPDKAMRWLGYMQGVLVARRIITLDQAKSISKSASEGKL